MREKKRNSALESTRELQEEAIINAQIHERETARKVDTSLTRGLLLYNSRTSPLVSNCRVPQQQRHSLVVNQKEANQQETASQQQDRN